MSISNDLVKQFVQITKDNSPVKTESTVYGTTVEYEGQMYVQIDGSDLITPVETTTELKSGERVTVMIKDHNATVTGNLSNPAAGSTTVANIKGNLDDIGSQITEFEVVIADKVSTKDFEANNAAINKLLAGKADVVQLNAVTANIRDLEAEHANIHTLISDKANITDLTAANAKIDDLTANKANVGDLEAATADINDLNADIAKISTLIGGDANIDNVQTIILTSDNTTIDNALIKNAMIDTISADKITSGTVNTNNVNIVSEDGGIVLAGSTQQFKDQNGNVRVQIGKDAEGNFTFCLFSQDGTGILLDETGIKAGAVPDGLIVNDMVADNANISGNKLDISSVIKEINGNTSTINSSIIKFDDTGQSLLVAFNSLKDTVSSIQEITIDGDLSSVMEQVKTNTTKLEVVQGSVETLVANTTITKENGEVVQLKDDYAVTKQTVGEITNKIGTLETNYKKTLKSSSVQYYLSNSLTSLSGGEWSDTAPEWTEGKYMWQRMKYTYTDNSVTYGSASCIAGAKGDPGEQGPQGDSGDSGVGISKITNYYLAINSKTGITTTMTGWTTTIQLVSEDKRYLWNYEKVEYTNNTETKTDPCIIGVYGDTGKGIQLITEYYATSTTKESLPTSWSTTVPTLTATDKYLWNYEKITYTDNTNVETDKMIIGVYGDKGDKGAKGDKGSTGEKGQSLISSSPQWYLSTSNTSQNGGSWSDTMPTVTTGRYVWVRFKNVWANPSSTTYTTPTLEQVTESIKEVHSKQAEFKETLDSISATVSENTSSLEGVSATVAQHTTDLTGISSKITSLEKNTSGLSKTVAQHTTDLSGVTSKISSLESSASGLNSRLQTAENKLTKDGITSIVGDYYAAGDATRDALSRIEQKADSVTTTVSNLKVGGTNLLLNTQFEGAVAGGRSFPNWIITKSCVIYGNYGQPGYNKMNTMYLGNDNANSDGSKTGYMYHTLTSERFQKNTEYTLSLDLEAENNVKGWEVVIRYYDANSNLLANQVIFDNSTHSAGHLVSTFTSKNIDANMVQFCIGHKGSTSGDNAYLLIVGNLMLEKGNIATGWQPSPQDMASKSIVTQTANDVRYEFKSIAGENLIYNGDARGAGNAWTDNSGGEGTFGRYISDNLGKNFYRNTKGTGFTHDWIKLENNTEYYYSARIASDCDYNSDNSSTFEPMHCWCNNTDSSGQAGMIVLDYNQKIVKDKWVYCYIHFKTTGDSGIKFKPFIYAPGITGSYIGATDIMLYKGSMWKSYSPNPNEVLSNTTIVNRDGVTVKHTSGTSTNLNSTALNFYDSSNRLYAQVDGGQYKFWYGSTYIGYLGHNGWVEDPNRRNVALCCEPDSFIALGAKQSSSNGSNYPIYLVATGNDKTISSTKYNHGVTIIRPHMNGIMKLYSKADNTDTYPAQIFNNNSGQLILQGDNITDLCISNGSSICVGFRVKEDNNQSNNAALFAYGPLDMNRYTISNSGWSNPVNATSAQTYASRTLSNEERYSDPTSETITNIYMSQTLTEGEVRWSDRETHHTSECKEGVYECYIEMPWWIAQNLENNYHVNITCTNGFYQYYVSEKDPYYFIVRSDKDSMGFTFEIVGKLLDNNTTANNANIAATQYLTSEVTENNNIPTIPIDNEPVYPGDIVDTIAVTENKE